MEIPLGGSGVSACTHSCLKFLQTHHLLVQEVQTIYFAYGRVWVSPLPHGIPSPESAFIELQSTIHKSLTPHKIVGQKATSKYKGDSNEPLNISSLITQAKLPRHFFLKEYFLSYVIFCLCYQRIVLVLLILFWYFFICNFIALQTMSS